MAGVAVMDVGVGGGLQWLGKLPAYILPEMQVDNLSHRSSSLRRRLGAKIRH